MDDLFDQFDEQVNKALQTLFPPADQIPDVSDAQQRAQDFSKQVSVAHSQLVELKSKIDNLPSSTDDSKVMLEKNIDELRQEIKLKDEVLEKHRKILSDWSERLDSVAKNNKTLL